MIQFNQKRINLIYFFIFWTSIGINSLNAEIDTDGDGLPDVWEQDYSLNPADPTDGESDEDEDSLTALQEYQLKTDPTLYDTQGIGLSDSLFLGLQGYYSLNETNGIVALDQTPYQRNGFVYEGGAWNAQIGVGGALELQNTLGYLQIDGSLINQQSSVTLSFLFRTQYPGKQILFNAGNEQSVYELVAFLWTSDYLWWISGINGFTDWNMPSLADNEWHRFAFVRDVQDQSLSAWVDDKLIGKANRSLEPLNVVPNGFIFGRGAWGWTTYGDFDEVRVYNRALKPTELQELYSKSDMDKDGLADDWELKHFGNTMTKNGNEDDADLDGMPDAWELEHGLNPADPADAQSDDDGDSLTALQEYQLKTDPSLYDTQGFGMSDSLLLGLQGYYPLNETEGIVAFDQTPYQRNGFLQDGGVWNSEAGVGGALSLNNTLGYLQLDGDLVNKQSNVTLSFLFKTQYPGKQMFFNAGNEQSAYELLGYVWESDYLWWISGVNGFTDWHIDSLADNKWHQLTFVRDAQAQKLSIWVDDQLAGEADRSLVPLNVSSNNFIMGRGAWGWTTYAQFDEVRVYNRALKVAELQELYSKSDQDQDGLPDSWELEHFDNTASQSGWDDADNDGKSNQEEQQQGTDPNDYYEGVSPTLTITQGNNQKGSINQFLPQPLVVKVEKEGEPLYNAPVVFTVLSGNGKLSVDNTGNSPLLETIEVKSDDEGLAKIYYKQALDYEVVSTIKAQANQSAVEFQATTMTYEESDSDNDGMLDVWENTYGLNPLDDKDCLQDLDGDRIPNVYEFANNTLPNDKNSFPAPHYIVDPVNGANSPNDNIYKTIKEAIDKAPAQTNVYSVISVKAATYYETIIFKGKNILLLGELGKDSLPILSLKKHAETVRYYMDESAKWGLDGFIITHEPGYVGEAVSIEMNKNETALLSHCVLRANLGSWRTGGIDLRGGRLWVNHCVIADNQSGNEGLAHGIYVFEGELILQNSIVWNEAVGGQKQIDSYDYGHLTLTNSIVLNGEYGALAVNPKLTPSFRLKASSPARDAGAALAISRWDWDGEWRNNPVDIGIDEFIDNDNDGMADAWETEQGLDKNNSVDAGEDGDADGLTNLAEYEAGTNPQLADSDGDGLKDGEEVNLYQTDPTKVDTDGDAMSDSYEVAHQLKPLDKTDKLEDKDGDRVPNVYEFANNTAANDAQSLPQPHYVVDPVNGANSPNDNIYSTVQQAISAAPTVNTKPDQFTIIQVLPGNYTNGVSISSRRILLLGESEGKQPPVLTHYNNNYVVDIAYRDAVMDGFIIERHPQRMVSVGLHVNIISSLADDEVRLVNCLIRNHQKSFGAIHGGSPLSLSIHLVHCTLWNNQGITAGAASLFNKVNLHLENCIVWDESAAKEFSLETESKVIVDKTFVRGGEEGGLDTDPKLHADGFLGMDSAALNQAKVMPVAQVDLNNESRANLPDIGADEFVDTDGDGVPDWWEKVHGFDPNDPSDADIDTDADGLTNEKEFYFNSDYTVIDTDGDTLKDGEEVNVYHTNPIKVDTDGDGMPDGWEVKYGFDPLTPSANVDHDQDGLSDYEEYVLQQVYGEGLDPTNPDSNGDGVIDGVSIGININPVDQDVDKDGLTNVVELEEIGTSPFNPDTDGDGVNDKDDAFPLDPNQSQLPPGDPQDQTAPVITLKEPENAVLMP